MMKSKHIETILGRAAIADDAVFGSIIPPLYTSTIFEMQGFNKKGPYDYSRTRNPTRDALVKVLSELDGGENATVTSSGMACLTLVLHLLGPDDVIVAPFDCYGRSHRLLQMLAAKNHFQVRFVDFTDQSQVKDVLTLKPAMILIETPSNPLMRITDIESVCKAAKQANPDCLIVADNTFLTPILQRPLELGCDIVYHSTTKFLNGHSDVVGGAVIAKSQEIWEHLDVWALSLGLVGSPFDSYQTLRGMRTLKIRVEQQQKNAQTIIERLQSHQTIGTIYYAGLQDHPGYEIAMRQQDGFGAMVSFAVNTDNAEKLQKFVESLTLFNLAQSLGGTESLIAHPATMTHAGMLPEDRAKAGITNRLFRLSVGLENADDLADDLCEALDRL